MELKFHDPLQSKTFTVQSIDQLTQHLSLLPGQHHIQFVESSFPLDPQFLKDLSIQLQHDSVKGRYTFKCEIAADELTKKAAESLKKMRFTHIHVAFDPNKDTSIYASLFKVCELTNLGLNLDWPKDTEDFSEESLAKAYHFLQGHTGLYKLHMPDSALLERDSKIGFYYNRLARVSQEFTPVFRFNKHLSERIYPLFYEYLRKNFSPHVKTILEIHPHGDQVFYQDYDYQSYPWKVTKLPIKNHALDLEKLQSIGKTFDAIVLFQSLETLKDPKKDLLILQNYARHTTEWGIFDYNNQSLPMLIQLLQHQYSNSLPLSNQFERLKLVSAHSIRKMFEFLGIHFNLQPVQAETDEFLQTYHQISPILKQEAEDLSLFNMHYKDIGFMGIGTLLITDDQFSEDGFITSGFDK